MLLMAQHSASLLSSITQLLKDRAKEAVLTGVPDQEGSQILTEMIQRRRQHKQ